MSGLEGGQIGLRMENGRCRNKKRKMERRMTLRTYGLAVRTWGVRHGGYVFVGADFRLAGLLSRLR